MKAEKLTQTLSWSAFLLLVILFIYPKPYYLLMTLSILFPIVAILMVRISKGKFKVLETETVDPRPSVIYLIIWPSLALIYRIYLDFNVFENTLAWQIALISMFVLLFVLLFKNPAFQARKIYDWLTLLIISGLFLLHGYCAVIVINCGLDSSEAHVYHAKVLHKRVNNLKGSTHYLGLSAWGKYSANNEFVVSETMFKRAELNDEIDLAYRKGELGIPWVELSIADYDYYKPRPK
jgi:hypothetical protein